MQLKACIIQPPYSYDLSKSDEYFDFKLACLDSCDESVDIIVLPEYSDVPCVTSDLRETLFYHNKYIDALIDRCVSTAKRCGALVFVNALSKEAGGYRNTTFAFDKNGALVGKYFKKHLPPLEFETLQLDSGYTLEPSSPYVITVDGVRYGFLTCYDFYFYEAFANIARNNVDVIIGCSLQRSDTHDAIETMCRFLAYNTNAYVLRSSVSFSEDSDVCGAAMAVSPRGSVLGNMRGRFGSLTVEFDPHEKYYKPAGFGNPDAAHYQYIEYGRKPWQYRPAGPAIVLPDKLMPYPRICAHRGFSTVAPENSLPAFGAAVALGAQEIEFDLWYTKDGEIVSIHDSTLERVSNGCGKVFEHTYDELLRLDFGSKYSEKFAGLRIIRFEDILKKLACHVVMNVHIKTVADRPHCFYERRHMQKIIDLIDKYDCREYVYFMSGNDNVLALAREMAPDIARVCGEESAVVHRERETRIVERAVRYGCKKLQFFKPFFSQALIDEAHANGIRCNIFWSDDRDEAKEFLKMGIDTVLTNDYNNVSQVLE